MFTDTEFNWSQNRGCHQRLFTNMLHVSHIRWNVCNQKVSLCVAACIKNSAADRRSCIRWKKSIGSRASCRSCTDWWEVGNCTGITWGHETSSSYAETSLFLALAYCSKQKCWGKRLAVSLRYMEILYKIMWFKLLFTVYIKNKYSFCLMVEASDHVYVWPQTYTCHTYSFMYGLYFLLANLCDTYKSAVRHIHDSMLVP